MMRKLLITGLILASVPSIFAQDTPDEALRAYLGEDMFIEIRDNSPEKMATLEFQNEWGYYVADNPGKWSNEELLDALEVEPRSSEFPTLTPELLEEGINFLAYSFIIPAEGYQYYRIGDSNRIVVVLSDQLLNRLKTRTEQ